jgi:hypothetical protein
MLVTLTSLNIVLGCSVEESGTSASNLSQVGGQTEASLDFYRKYCESSGGSKFFDRGTKIVQNEKAKVKALQERVQTLKDSGGSEVSIKRAESKLARAEFKYKKMAADIFYKRLREDYYNKYYKDFYSAVIRCRDKTSDGELKLVNPKILSEEKETLVLYDVVEQDVVAQSEPILCVYMPYEQSRSKDLRAYTPNKSNGRKTRWFRTVEFWLAPDEGGRPLVGGCNRFVSLSR